MLHLYPFLMIHHLFRYNLFLKYLQLILTSLDLKYLHFLSYLIHFLIVYVLSQILPYFTKGPCNFWNFFRSKNNYYYHKNYKYPFVAS